MLITKYTLLRLITNEYGEEQQVMISYYAALNELKFVKLISARIGFRVQQIGNKRYIIK